MAWELNNNSSSSPLWRLHHSPPDKCIIIVIGLDSITITASSSTNHRTGKRHSFRTGGLTLQFTVDNESENSTGHAFCYYFVYTITQPGIQIHCYPAITSLKLKIILFVALHMQVELQNKSR